MGVQYDNRNIIQEYLGKSNENAGEFRKRCDKMLTACAAFATMAASE